MASISNYYPTPLVFGQQYPYVYVVGDESASVASSNGHLVKP